MPHTFKNEHLLVHDKKLNFNIWLLELEKVTLLQTKLFRTCVISYLYL